MSAAPHIRFSSFETRDLEAVVAIEISGFGRPWTARQFIEETRVAFSHFVVARSTDERSSVAGYVIWRLVLDELQIFNIAVEPNLKRRGLGKALLEHALKEGAAHGANAATLEVHCHNEDAIGFYRALGFVEVGRRRNYYGAGDDAILMEKSLVGCG